MSRTAQIVWQSIGISLVAMVLIAAIVWGYMMTPTQSPCVALDYIITDRSERLYITEEELSSLLMAEDIHPVGRQLNRLSLHRIERVILAHPMIRTAECYLTPRGEVKVRITQREPLLRVQTPGETYFIDTDRRVMPYRPAVKDDLLVVTGTVGVQIASTRLADFAHWIQENAYWRTRVHHLYLTSPQMVYIYLRGENQPRIVLGAMNDYERKLRKLRTFWENSATEIQTIQYTELDLRFKGQVIGRK